LRETATDAESGRFSPVSPALPQASVLPLVMGRSWSMNPLANRRRSLLPVLYVGDDLTRDAHESLRAHRIGVVVAENTARAKRMLSQFRVAAIVFAAPDLPGLAHLSTLGIPLVVLAARDALCDLPAVTVVPRHAGGEELAAMIHGVTRREPAAARDAA
jgi:hypothetical protein